MIRVIKYSSLGDYINSRKHKKEECQDHRQNRARPLIELAQLTRIKRGKAIFINPGKSKIRL